MTALADHNLTLIVRKLTKQQFNISRNKKPYRVRTPRCNLTEFENAIEEINWSDCLQTNVRDNSQSVISAMLSVINGYQKVIKTKHGLIQQNLFSKMLLLRLRSLHQWMTHNQFFI